MTDLHVVFSHGQESGPTGTKIDLLSDVARKRGARVDSIDYRADKTPADRIVRLVASARQIRTPLVLVGSSLGAYVSLVACRELSVAALFLMAPAVFIDAPGYDAQSYDALPSDVVVVHGWGDEVVPVANAIRFAQQARAELTLLDAGHRLSEGRSLAALAERFDAQLARLVG
jgi:predicted alpha/beta hydrolase family esterase